MGDSFAATVMLVVLVVLATVAMETAAGLNTDGTALLAFKKSIHSDPQNTFQSWNSSDATPCRWTGITCVRIQPSESKSMEDHVVSIDLSRKDLRGTLSPALGALPYLATLNLQSNKLSGQIPKELFKAGSALSRLQLSTNNFTGGIPAEIGRLGAKLRVLEIRNNILTGLPQEIVECYHLRRLVLSNNRIGGEIPVGMGGRFKDLERLDLSVNQFYGGIPDDFGNLTSLLPQAPLNLSNNRFSGPIPPSLSNLRSIPIDLCNNELSGHIPTSTYFQSQGPVAYLGNPALCGSPLKITCPSSPSPSPSPSPSSIAAITATPARNLNKDHLNVVAISVGSAIAGFMLMASLVLYIVVQKLNKPDARCSSSCWWRFFESGNGATEDEDDEEGDLVHMSGVYSFSLEELLRASAYVVGTSGGGTIVYKAVLDEGTVMAVRRIGEGGEGKRREFESEVKGIAGVRHGNVVGLHSYSWRAEEKLLVYEWVANGSLDTALHGRPEGPLTWAERLRIARGAARGIAHIHECGSQKLVHGDIKPSNILLDGFMEPRIAGLGLHRLLALMEPEREPERVNEDDSSAARSGPADSSRSSASSVSPAPEFAIGASTGGCERRSAARPFSRPPTLPSTRGVWQAPDTTTTGGNNKGSNSNSNAKSKSKKPAGGGSVALAGGAATQKSDVHSFGVVLLELLKGQSTVTTTTRQVDVVAWLRAALQQKSGLGEVFDAALLAGGDDDYAQTQMIQVLQVALACIAVNPESRPKMKQVADFFEQIQATS